MMPVNLSGYGTQSIGVTSLDIDEVREKVENGGSGTTIGGITGLMVGGVGGGIAMFLILTSPLTFGVGAAIGLGLGALLGSMAVGAGLVGGISYLIESFKTRKVSAELFNSLNANAPKIHELNEKEITATITVLEKDGRYDSAVDLFRKMNPRQVLAFVGKGKEDEYSNWLIRNATYYSLALNRVDIENVKKDPYLRVLYERMRAKEMKPIDSSVFELDFPNVASKMKFIESEGNSKELQERKVKVIDTKTGAMSEVPWAFVSKFSTKKPEELTDGTGRAISVLNLQDFQQVVQILERKSGIVNHDELEAVMKVAEQWQLDDLIKDLELMIRNREDLFENEEQLRDFIFAHPAFGYIKANPTGAPMSWNELNKDWVIDVPEDR